ncbi:hypothetical protein OAV88_03400 [bacterium]|nr:hypothetical protein [bacterium]
MSSSSSFVDYFKAIGKPIQNGESKRTFFFPYMYLSDLSIHLYFHLSPPTRVSQQRKIFFCFSNFHTERERERERCHHHHHHHHLLIISKRSVFPKLERTFFFPYMYLSDLPNHIYFHLSPPTRVSHKEKSFFVFPISQTQRERER